MKITMKGDEMSETDVKAFRKIFSDYFKTDFTAVITSKDQAEVVFEARG